MLTYRTGVEFDPEVLWDRFWSYVTPTGFCWYWPSKADYGSFSLGVQFGGYVVKPHRLAYLLLVGQFDTKLELDHLCRNTRCVNPDHLEPVIKQINQDRSPITKSGLSKSKRCSKGHELSEETSYRRTDTGTLKCRVCQYEWGRDQNKRKAMVKFNVSFDDAENYVRKVGSYRPRNKRSVG